MPSYEIAHSISLTPSQQDALAEAITSVHLSKFPLVPNFFVKVAFKNISQQIVYTGGKRHQGNDLTGRVRLGDRTTADFEEMRDQFESAWNSIVLMPAVDRLGPGERARYTLHRIILVPVNPIGKEFGFELPLAGTEKAWLEKHWVEFKRRADEGDEMFKEVVKSVETNGIW